MTTDSDKLSVFRLQTTWDDFHQQYKVCYSRHGRDGKSWAADDRPYWLIHKDVGNERAHWTKHGYSPSKEDIYAAVRNKRLAEGQKLEQCTHTWTTEPYLSLFRTVAPEPQPQPQPQPEPKPEPQPQPTEQPQNSLALAKILNTDRWKRTALYLSHNKDTDTLKCPTHKKNDQPCPCTCTHKEQWRTGVPTALLDKIEHSLNKTRQREDQRKQKRQKVQSAAPPPAELPDRPTAS